MRNRASFILVSVALAQLLFLAAALAVLVAQLQNVRAGLARLGQQEQAFLDHLSATERDLYRTSILLRDNIFLEEPERLRASLELQDVLHRLSSPPLPRPDWLSPETQAKLDTVDAVRVDYLSRARSIFVWRAQDRRALGQQFLTQQLAPMRRKFISTASEIAALVHLLRDSRNLALARSVEQVQSLIVKVVLAASGLSVLFAAVAFIRFRNYESERDLHTRNLEHAENGLRSLSQRLVESQEQERKKISRELHDEVGQSLTALSVQLGQIEPAGIASQTHLAQAADLASRSLRAIRSIARGLRPAMLDDLGLGPALNWLGRDFSKNTPLDVSIQLEGEFSTLSEPLRTCLYRVVQESLTNCVKHSQATSVRVILHESPSEIVLTVQDDGIGFTPSRSAGIGLLGMRERVEELGGDFAVISAARAGTLIRARLPSSTPEKL